MRMTYPDAEVLTYQLGLAYDSIHNITAKNQSDVITQPSGTPVAQKKTSYVFNYAYNPSGTNIVWDEDNRVQSLFDNGHEKTYVYDDAGQRIVNKDGTVFDMIRTRVKETDLNPYVPGGTRHVKYEDALNTQGTKRAPSPAELHWFDSIHWWGHHDRLKNRRAN